MTDAPKIPTTSIPPASLKGPTGKTLIGLPPLVVGALVVAGFLCAALIFAGVSRSMGRRVVKEKKPLTVTQAPKTVVEVVPMPSPTGPVLSESAPLPKDLPALTLGGILFSKDGESYALINGKIVREGTAVSGVTLKKVLPDKVELDFEGRRVIMRSL
jgi:hypothetical protein